MGTLSRRGIIAIGAALIVPKDLAVAAGPAMTLWKHRGCACCTAWARHFEAAGFTVTANEVGDLGPARAAAGVPPDLAGCHTAIVEGYVVEGHVPVRDVKRLLADRPAVLGLAVPGMPAGSPGMEIPGMAGDAYDVIAFARDGTRTVFCSIPAGTP